MKKTVLALMAAVFVLTVGIGTADAAWTSSFTTAKKVLQNANSTTLASQSAAGAIAYTLGTGESLNTNDTLQITLTGGAKFSSTAPILTTTGGTAFATIVGSPTGLTTANFRVTSSALIVSDVISINVQGTIFDVSAVTGNVDVGLSATTSVGGLTIFNAVQSSATGAKFAFSAPSAMDSASVLATTNVADVSATAGAFKRFTGNVLTSTAATFNYTNLSDETAGGTAPSGQQISAGKVVFNIAGGLTGIASISGTGCTGSDAAGVASTPAAANKFSIATGAANAYCFNTAVVPPAAAGTIALAPVFTLDGTTAQAARGFTASVAFLADGTKWAAHTPLAATALYSITRNGSSFVTNSVGPRNSIKITDRSNGIGTAGGAITVTAWDASGISIPDAGTTALVLNNNATTTITGTALAARFPTGTPMKYEFAVESSSIDVTNVKASTDGTFSATTVYTNGSGGAL